MIPFGNASMINSLVPVKKTVSITFRIDWLPLSRNGLKGRPCIYMVGLISIEKSGLIPWSHTLKWVLFVHAKNFEKTLSSLCTVRFFELDSRWGTHLRLIFLNPSPLSRNSLVVVGETQKWHAIMRALANECRLRNVFSSVPSPDTGHPGRGSSRQSKSLFLNLHVQYFTCDNEYAPSPNVLVNSRWMALALRFLIQKYLITNLCSGSSAYATRLS
jgi:hypothetical protein